MRLGLHHAVPPVRRGSDDEHGDRRDDRLPTRLHVGMEMGTPRVFGRPKCRLLLHDDAYVACGVLF